MDLACSRPRWAIESGRGSLWLEDEVVSSLRLYPDYRGDSFAPHSVYPLDRLHRTREGDVMVAITTNEENPAAVYPIPGTQRWHYAGAKVTQYWRKPKGSFQDDLRAAVNGRCTYYRLHRPIPGGIAFENFELQERFREGQSFIFGMTRRTPAELGFSATIPGQSQPSDGPRRQSSGRDARRPVVHATRRTAVVHGS